MRELSKILVSGLAELSWYTYQAFVLLFIGAFILAIVMAPMLLAEEYDQPWWYALYVLHLLVAALIVGLLDAEKGDW